MAPVSRGFPIGHTAALNPLSSYKGRSHSCGADIGESAREGGFRETPARGRFYHLLAFFTWAERVSSWASAREHFFQPRGRVLLTCELADPHQA